MTEQMLEALITLIHQGGWMAIAVIVAWGFIGITKMLIIGGTICFISQGTLSLFRQYFNNKSLWGSRDYHLVSKETSEELMKYLGDLQTAHQKLMKDLNDQYTSLKKDLTDSGSTTKETKPANG